MSVLYEILIATVFSALLSPQTEVKKTEPEKVQTEQLSEQSISDCSLRKKCN